VDHYINEQVIGLLQALSGNLSLLPLTQLAAVLMLVVWRRVKYGFVPRVGECAALAGHLLALYVAVLTMLVLTFTYPTKFEFLAPYHLALAGLYTVGITAYQVGPLLRKLIFPEAPGTSPEQGGADPPAATGQKNDKVQSAKH
jgi:hypothetical protein